MVLWLNRKLATIPSETAAPGPRREDLALEQRCARAAGTAPIGQARWDQGGKPGLVADGEPEADNEADREREGSDQQMPARAAHGGGKFDAQEPTGARENRAGGL